MVKPNQPKDIKPKTEEDKTKLGAPSNNGNIKIILINIVTTLVICIMFISLNYILQDSLLSNKLKTITTTETTEEEEITEEEIERGIIVDLGDFILNLSDVDQKKYLKVNVALELSKLPTDPDLNAPAQASGGGGHGAAPAPDPFAQLQQEMSQFKPAIRDAVITNLSSKNAAEIATAAGKELAKEQIAQDVNAIFAGEREVLRVSFGQFIIQ